ncbi:glycoside hydrolase family 2 TIM barrel-domain containing protein [Maribacter vaceletii]|nr:glycoside hydrolase family 2 TIM barrel-domain containing protein [Maribacter vaceletii]
MAKYISWFWSKNRSYFSFVFILIITASCSSQTTNVTNDGEEQISLSGIWKFNTFLGDGSNYLDIQPEENDIVIDNSQTQHIIIKGKWVTKTVADRETSFWKEDYLSYDYRKNNDPASVKFKTNVPKTGYYEHFIYYPAGSHMATHVNVKHANGIYIKDFNQKTRPSVWLSLGIFKIQKNSSSYIEFNAFRKGTATVDAVMLRPVNEKEFTKELQNKKGAALLEYDDSDWHNLKVPGHFGMINKYSNYSGKGWYRKEISLPKSWKKNSKERIRVQFEGVYHVARVFLNGKYIGRHQGGFTPFEFDITDEISFSGKNILAVEADNNYLVGATWNWGGIIREVTLVKNKEVRVKSQYIHAEPNLKSGTASYKVKVRVENNSGKTKSLKLTSVLIKEKPIHSTSTQITIAPNSIKEFELEGLLQKEDVKLWHFDNPQLYNIETSVTENNNLLHRKIDRFGIRKFEATATQMLLNGEPVRLVGFNRVSDHRYWGSSEPQELINKDVDLMKNAGANFNRIMHGTQNKKLLDRCDEKGILIFEEANIRELKMPEIYEDDFAYPKQWIREMIERDANHPSIVGWSVGNELEDHFEYVKMAYEYAKKIDPNRLVLHVSNRGYRKGESPSNNPLQYGDMIFQNIYQKDPGAVMDTLHARWPNKAMFFSEFGVERFTTASLDNNVTKLGDWYNHMRNQRPYTTGASIWTYNDYKSGYSQTLPDENRAWGMVNAWRTKRRAFYTHQKENSPVTNFKIENVNLKKGSAVVSFKVRDLEDFPSFTMKDYTLQYSFKNNLGIELIKEKVNLPILTPGMGQWQGNIFWKSLKETPYSLSVALVSTNGYTRREKTIYFNVPSKPVIEEVKASENKIRVHFTKNIDAFEYYLKYSIDGQEKESYKTIANYIDLDSLPSNKVIELQLISSNSKGDSKASKSSTITTKGTPLAPIVWDYFIKDNNLIIGYSGAFEDISYTVKYGSSTNNLSREEKSNSRGIMIIPIANQEQIYFQIKRTTTSGDSQWSNSLHLKK